MLELRNQFVSTLGGGLVVNRGLPVLTWLIYNDGHSNIGLHSGITIQVSSSHLSPHQPHQASESVLYLCFLQSLKEPGCCYSQQAFCYAALAMLLSRCLD